MFEATGMRIPMGAIRAGVVVGRFAAGGDGEAGADERVVDAESEA
jgi:hypothetical protein